MAEALKDVKQKLTPRERKFLKAYIQGASETDAYLLIAPTVTRPSAGVGGTRMLNRIKKKIDWGQILEYSGLDDTRLAREIEKGLNAKITKFSGAECLGEFEDNTTQARTRELLAELRGKRKSQIDVSGEVTVKGYISVSPDDWDDAAGI